MFFKNSKIQILNNSITYKKGWESLVNHPVYYITTHYFFKKSVLEMYR